MTMWSAVIGSLIRANIYPKSLPAARLFFDKMSFLNLAMSIRSSGRWALTLCKMDFTSGIAKWRAGRCSLFL